MSTQPTPDQPAWHDLKITIGQKHSILTFGPEGTDEHGNLVIEHVQNLKGMIFTDVDGKRFEAAWQEVEPTEPTEPSPTPETDAAASKREISYLNAGWTVEEVPADFARKLERERDEARSTCQELVTDSSAATLAATVVRLERERDAAKEQIRLIIKHDHQRLESDSIVAACDCNVKTNEVKFHKPGCKYRLICERDTALERVGVLKSWAKDITSSLRAKDKRLPSIAEVCDRIAGMHASNTEKDAQIVALQEALRSIASEASKIWLANAPVPDIARIEKIAETALITLPPTVVPLVDVRPLVEALAFYASCAETGTLQIAGGEAAEKALEKFMHKHKLP